MREATSVGDNTLIEETKKQLLEIDIYAEALEVEEERFEQKIGVEEEAAEIATEVLLERIENLEELRMEADEERKQAKQVIEKAWAKANEQNINKNPIIMGLIKQAERFNERGLILFEQREYKKSYLNSEKAIDFAEKAFKLINVKENLRKGRPNLPIFPNILPVEPVPDPEIPNMRFQDKEEEIKKYIKSIEQTIEKTRILITDRDIVSPPVVIKLIERAEDNIDRAIALIEGGIFDSAHRHATRAKEMVIRADRIIVGKLQTGEIKITPDSTEIIPPPSIITPKPIQTPSIEVMRCRADADCLALICITLVGQNTPQCDKERGICICGPSWEVNRREIYIEI